jgi:SHS family lactate transporter-like MFS transporter
VLGGLLQQGYAIGFLLASAAYFLLPQHYGWRPLFYLGSVPALVMALLVFLNVRESATWKANRTSSFKGLGQALFSQWKLFIYFTLFMMAMHMSSHGTQDMYPTFLEKDWGIVGKQKAVLSAVSMIGAIIGGLTVGRLSDIIGRRWAIVGALLGAIVVIPLWAHAHTIGMLVFGAIAMQFFVQGAWGVVPAHVAELSPDSIRATLPGLGNQTGVLLASSVVYIEAAFAKGRNFATSMSLTAATVFLLAVVLTLVWHERRGGDLTSNTP